MQTTIDGHAVAWAASGPATVVVRTETEEPEQSVDQSGRDDAVTARSRPADRPARYRPCRRGRSSASRVPVSAESGCLESAAPPAGMSGRAGSAAGGRTRRDHEVGSDRAVITGHMDDTRLRTGGGTGDCLCHDSEPGSRNSAVACGGCQGGRVSQKAAGRSPPRRGRRGHAVRRPHARAPPRRVEVTSRASIRAAETSRHRQIARARRPGPAVASACRRARSRGGHHLLVTASTRGIPAYACSATGPRRPPSPPPVR